MSEFFRSRHPDGQFELVAVPDMSKEGCYDEAVKGELLAHCWVWQLTRDEVGMLAGPALAGLGAAGVVHVVLTRERCLSCLLPLFYDVVIYHVYIVSVPSEINLYTSFPTSFSGQHVASIVTGGSPQEVIPPVVVGRLNTLKSAAKEPSVMRFVYTSSSVAATLVKPNVALAIGETTYNEEAIQGA